MANMHTTRTHTCTHAHTNTNTCIHTHTHTHTQLHPLVYIAPILLSIPSWHYTCTDLQQLVETGLIAPVDEAEDESPTPQYRILGFGFFADPDPERRGFYVDEISFSSENRDFVVEEVSYHSDRPCEYNIGGLVCRRLPSSQAVYSH